MGEIKERKVIDKNGNVKSHEVEITLDANNYRKHDERNLKLIKKSLKECGAGRSILIDANGEIIAGNATYKTAKEANIPVKIIKTDGKELIAVQRTDLATTDKKRKKLALLDNTTSDKPNWDIDTISADFDLSELPELGLEDLPEVAQLEPEITEDEVPSDEQVETRVKKGDIWQLGDHRLMCGDSTVITDVEKLMGGEKADMTFTSPPYNGDNSISNGDVFAKKGSQRLYAEGYRDNLTSEDYIDFVSSVLEICFKYTEGYIFWNVNYNSNSRFEYIKQIIPFLPNLIEQVAWEKTSAIPLKGCMRRGWEPIYIFSTNGKNLQTEKVETNIWNISNTNSQVANHKACFPVGLPAKGISLVRPNSGIVFEPFGGSGSTLIACEQLKRKCRMMELDPHYCDVIITRWETLTGKQAQRIE